MGGSSKCSANIEPPRWRIVRPGSVDLIVGDLSVKLVRRLDCPRNASAYLVPHTHGVVTSSVLLSRESHLFRSFFSLIQHGERCVDDVSVLVECCVHSWSCRKLRCDPESREPAQVRRSLGRRA